MSEHEKSLWCCLEPGSQIFFLFVSRHAQFKICLIFSLIACLCGHLHRKKYEYPYCDSISQHGIWALKSGQMLMSEHEKSLWCCLEASSQFFCSLATMQNSRSVWFSVWLSWFLVFVNAFIGRMVSQWHLSILLNNHQKQDENVIKTCIVESCIFIVKKKSSSTFFALFDRMTKNMTYFFLYAYQTKWDINAFSYLSNFRN